MDVIKKAWVDTTYEAILTVERYLGIKGEETTEFSKLANWIYDADLSPELFMPASWENAKDTAQGFAQFLKALHQSMFDPSGAMCFVETHENGSFIVLDIPLNEPSWISEVFLKRVPSGYQGSYQAHQDVQRFIDHMTTHYAIAENSAVSGNAHNRLRLEDLVEEPGRFWSGEMSKIEALGL